ncbi:hypothetical protein HHI36_021871 [Cryptolaemus montrouzieri]|uniref:Nose resistant-to-fluoxetine protein N-terminal domain-containing protein n=1 Tax=Cryptolaemus montrouzieri TaxID=559131 RepID=A0ABD2MYU5_9CUCU
MSNAQQNIEETKEKMIESFDKHKDCRKQYDKDIFSRIKMKDASSKFVFGGILDGNFFDLGYYDECLNIKNDELAIYGKYCLASLPLTEIEHLFPKSYDAINVSRKRLEESKKRVPELRVVGSDPLQVGYHFGICVPDKCTIDDLKEIYPLLTIDESLCYSKTQTSEMNAGAIISLVVVGVVVLITVLSTIYDIINEYQETGIKHEALIAFSLYSNGRKLLRSSKNPDQLLCLNGLKALSMAWVVLGHTYANVGVSAATDNIVFLSDWMDDAKNMLIISGTLSVDTFFTVGGLLTVYTFMKTENFDLKESFKAVPLMYLHRYLRLTPAVAILVLLYGTGLLSYISDGPRWGSIQDLLINGCSEYWWSALLYIQNYENVQNLCMSQTWYLSVDMQLFLLSPFIMIPLKKWPKYVMLLMCGLMVMGIAIPFYIGYSNKLSGLLLNSEQPSFTYQYYFKTHARFGPYVIGMFTGYLIYNMKKVKKPLKFSMIFISFLWVLTLAILITCIFDGFHLVKHTDNALADGFYLGFNRSVWSCAVSLLILLCVFGNGGPVNWFLSLPVFQFLSKISYSIYLIHYGLITIANVSARDTFHFNNFNVILQFLVILC